MVEAGATTTGSARRQAQLWGRAAQDWAEHAEGLMSAYFTQVLEQLEVGPGVRLLDIGCGSGVAAAIAADRGAEVHGLDAVPEFVAYGRKRVPQAQFVQGELHLVVGEHRHRVRGVAAHDAPPRKSSTMPATRSGCSPSNSSPVVWIAHRKRHTTSARPSPPRKRQSRVVSA